MRALDRLRGSRLLTHYPALERSKAPLQELLDDAIEPVRARLKTNLMRADPAAMVAKDAKPRVLSQLADEFNPRSKRPGYPKSHAVYWE